jgi:hypothetical protein
MSMWARLGRFLEIYGLKFWDFQWKSDFHWKSSDYETRLNTAADPSAVKIWTQSYDRELQRQRCKIITTPRVA